MLRKYQDIASSHFSVFRSIVQLAYDLPWLALTPKIIVKCLSADLQRIAVKTDFSSVSAVICPDCNIHPFFSNAFIRFLSCLFSSAIFRDSSGLRSPQPISRLPLFAFLIQPYSVFTGI